MKLLIFLQYMFIMSKQILNSLSRGAVETVLITRQMLLSCKILSSSVTALENILVCRTALRDGQF